MRDNEASEGRDSRQVGYQPEPTPQSGQDAETTGAGPPAFYPENEIQAESMGLKLWPDDLSASNPSSAPEAADLLLDGITVALQDFDTDTLLAIADYRDSIRADGWMQNLIREYVEVWR